ncbi:MAG: hypothetical protein LAT75_02530 [Candidatus Cyclonatronum sp.]|uniref:hypothetical protein n=1 Tax=Cyclonatronum sp. TaxID=3024185 RepID=UPI0025B80504|nr:hypothetical protein [Cyclonatronum sp.]MCC5933038.1 hypothetical protein [Balneolales bacterium]MCH8485711.1 hypothetical protein [Cyclonatronum sp.]
MDKPVNYTKEAFLHPLNLALLIAAFSSAFFMSGSAGDVVNLIISITVAAELLYLGIVPRQPRFQKYINLRTFKERNSRFDERRIFGELSEASQKRFLVLKHITGLIRKNFEKVNYSSQGIIDNLTTRLEALLTSYILLLEGNERYRSYLESTTQARLQEEAEITQKEIEEAESPRLKQVLERRLIILNKRGEKYGAAREKYLISDSQLKTIEDTVRYIYEKSMTLSNTAEIEHQMDSLLLDLEDADSVFAEFSEGKSTLPSYLDELRSLEKEIEQTDELFRKTSVKTEN